MSERLRDNRDSASPLKRSLLALALVPWAALTRLALRLAASLRGADALDGTGRRLADDALREALAAHPLAGVRRFEARLASLYGEAAYHDSLTGVPNRKALLDRLAVAVGQGLRTREDVALLHIDLDHFRVIDNSLGRALSNQVLKQVAGRLLECVRAGDTVARVGDDEFALLLPRLAGLDEAAQVAQRALEAVKHKLVVDGREVFLTASLGISLCPRDGQDAETLLSNAHAATYLAKEGGQDSFRRYTARISAKDAKRLAIETALRGALARDELVLHYQPCVRMADGRVEAAEALLRCPGLGGSLLSPAEFIPVAESSGLIVDVGGWVLRRACAQAVEWRRAGLRPSVAVNLSARQFQQPDLLEQVQRVLDATGLEPAGLELEITETAAMQDMERSLETLRALRGRGISIAMDDFGTGFSSLSYLRKLPVDKLKLDKSFVTGVRAGSNDAAIAVAVIALAHSLGLKVVAEGVETEEELRFVRENGCDMVQGYLFSRPIPGAELGPLLEKTLAVT